MLENIISLVIIMVGPVAIVRMALWMPNRNKAKR